MEQALGLAAEERIKQEQSWTDSIRKKYNLSPDVGFGDVAKYLTEERKLRLAAEARVRVLEEALCKILEHKGVPCLEDDGTVSYAPSVGPLKNIARQALKGGTPDDLPPQG